MDKKVKNQLLNELENLTDTMIIPLVRQKDCRWLLDNAAINNSNHKNLTKVIRICEYLIEREENG